MGQRAPGTGEVPKRELLIFIPGLGSQGPQTLEALSLKLARALFSPRQPTATIAEQLQFRILPAVQQDAQHFSYIARLTPAKPYRSVITTDVFRLDYFETFTSPIERRNILIKSGLMVVAFALFILALVRMPFSRRRRVRGRTTLSAIQLGLSSFLLFLGVVYVLDVVASAIEILVKASEELDNPLLTRLPDYTAVEPAVQLLSDLTQRLAWAPVVAAIGAGVWLVLRVFGHRPEEFFTHLLVEYVAIIFYLQWGSRRMEIRDQLVAAMHAIVGSSPEGYDRICVAAYSFGSIVALDTLFPPRRDRARSRLHSPVDGLITIGCPYEIVRALWPRYFDDRIVQNQLECGWLNIYSPVDVLGSPLEQFGRGVLSIEPSARTTSPHLSAPRDEQYTGTFGKQLSFWKFLRATGFRAHAAYWETGDADDCTQRIAAELMCQRTRLRDRSR